MNLKEIPTTTVRNMLDDHSGIEMEDREDSELVGVVTDHSFDAIRHISDVLNQYGLQVRDTMWVDKGQEFYLEVAE